MRTAADNRFVRFVTPKEYWLSREPLLKDNSTYRKYTSTGALSLGYAQTGGNQTPFLLRFQGEAGLSPAGPGPAGETIINHTGPMFPLPNHNFEQPYIVLGGLLNSDLRSTSAVTVLNGSVPNGLSQVQFPGENFDTVGSWYATAGAIRSVSTDGITNLLLQSSRNLFDMLTAGGTDLTGQSSELYLVLTGDTTNANNCGVFRVIGAGTTGYTFQTAATFDAVVIERVGVGAGAGPWPIVATTGLTAEIRSQYTNTQDGNAVSDGASAVVVLTDIEGASSDIAAWQLTEPVKGNAILDTSVMYGPSRGGTARVASSIDRIGLVSSTANLVRNSPTALDSTFASEAGVPSGEFYFPTQHVQTWNRLPSLGLNAPYAPNYGDGRYMVQQRRDAEVFVDAGSKTLQIRPFQQAETSLEMRVISAGALIPPNYTGVTDTNAGAVFETSMTYGFEFPPEFMPRFGRQDIPFHRVDAGGSPTTGPVYYGINHLFGDSQTTTDAVFRVIGGPDNGGVAADPLSMFFVTGSTNTLDYGEYGTGTGLSTGGYKARLVEDVNVISSDLPKGLNGIQLPPFLGVARFGILTV